MASSKLYDLLDSMITKINTVEKQAGPAGPVGPTGPSGSNGAAGPVGPTGPSGSNATVTILDSLSTTRTDAALSANQGKVLHDFLAPNYQFTGIHPGNFSNILNDARLITCVLEIKDVYRQMLWLQYPETSYKYYFNDATYGTALIDITITSWTGTAGEAKQLKLSMSQTSNMSITDIYLGHFNYWKWPFEQTAIL